MIDAVSDSVCDTIMDYTESIHGHAIIPEPTLSEASLCLGLLSVGISVSQTCPKLASIFSNNGSKFVDNEDYKNRISPKLHGIIQRCNNFLLKGSSKKQCVPFIVDGHTVGIIRPDILQPLLRYSDTFTLESETPAALHIADHLDTYEKRSNRFAGILHECRIKRDFVALKGWRNEPYHIWTEGRQKALMEIERSAAGCFGIIQYGVHIHGYVNHPQRGKCVWVGRRSLTKSTWPGMLDNMAAGGLSVGLQIIECARKECQEEASVSDIYLRKLRPSGAISFCYEDKRGIFPEIMYTFDLELDMDFQPICSDGEVGEFLLLSCDELLEKIISEEFKPTSALSALDFLIRHGVISPDKESRYGELIMGMHLKLPFEIE